jgi:uncharacterized protein YqeY
LIDVQGDDAGSASADSTSEKGLDSTVSLSQRIDDDLKDAMRAGDARRRDVIRYLRAGLTNARIDKRAELDDQEVLGVIRQQIKQRQDSIEMFRAGGRPELADEEAAQIAILDAYLPARMPDSELVTIVQRLADELDVRSSKDMSRLMPALIAAVEGRADNRALSQIARDEIARRSAADATR